eukprot:g4087.t1
MEAEKLVGVRVQGYTVKKGVARYNIHVVLQRADSETGPTILELEAARQRWSVCVALDQTLKKRFSKTKRMPVLVSPNRYLRGASKLDVAFLESRARALNDYLAELVKIREVRESEDFLEFLSNDIADAAELEKGTLRLPSSAKGNSFDKFRIEDSIRSQLRNVPFTDVRIGAKEVYEKEIHVSTAEVTVVYEFKTVSNDIGLSVGFRPDAGNASSRSVAAFSRWPSHSRNQLKHYSCPCPGTLILAFDNSYSKFRAKQLSYRFALTSTEALEWLVGQNGGASTASSSNDSMRVGSNNRSEHKRADDPVAHRETLGSATESAAETSAKQRPAKKRTGISTVPPLGIRFPGRMPTESFEVSAIFGRRFSNSVIGGAEAARNRPTTDSESSVSHSGNSDVEGELQFLREKLLQNEQEMNSMRAQLDDQNERNNHLQNELMEAHALKKEADEQFKSQFTARVELERGKKLLEDKIADLQEARSAADEIAVSLRNQLESSSQSASAEVDTLSARNRDLEKRLAETIAPLEETARDAKQLQQQAEAELMASRNMMRRHAAELQSLKPKYLALQGKVDRFKAEKRVLVKAVEELRTAKAVTEAQLEESRKFQEHQRQQYTQTQQQYAEMHRGLQQKSQELQELNTKRTVSTLKKSNAELRLSHTRATNMADKVRLELHDSLAKIDQLQSKNEQMANEHARAIAEAKSYASRTQIAAERAVSDMKATMVAAQRQAEIRLQREVARLCEKHKAAVEKLRQNATGTKTPSTALSRETCGSEDSTSDAGEKILEQVSDLSEIPALDSRSAPSSFDNDPRATTQQNQRAVDSSMASLGANLLSMIGRSPQRVSPSSSFTSQSSGLSGDRGATNVSKQATVSVAPASETTTSGGMSSMFSGMATGWGKWGSGGGTTNTKKTGGRSKQQQGERKITKHISWGILGEPQMQYLIRNDICAREQWKIDKLYNWLGHVLDGQPLSLLPTKGLELKSINMRTCGLFLDCVIPFLNENCHPDCKIEALWIISAKGDPSSPHPVAWRHARPWKLDRSDGGPKETRSRAWTVEALLGAEAAKEGGYIDWRSRFGLRPGQELGSVHLRIHMVTNRA